MHSIPPTFPTHQLLWERTRRSRGQKATLIVREPDDVRARKTRERGVIRILLSEWVMHSWTWHRWKPMTRTTQRSIETTSINSQTCSPTNCHQNYPPRVALSTVSA